jgi:serine protease Do
MYELPKFNFNFKNRIFWEGVVLVFLLCVMFFLINGISQIEWLNFKKVEEKTEDAMYVSNISYEQAIIDVAKNSSPSVVSIVISKDILVYEQEWVNPFPEFNIQIPQYVPKGSKLQDVGAGSGFIVSADGLVLTNKHVVSDNKAKYTIFTNEGKKYNANVLALDPMQDLAIIKIENSGEIFNPVVLGDSDSIQIGQTAIAIGNALGRFSNTVSVGVISGLGRTISASSKTGETYETLENIIQTDAAINEGNSGGPLLNLKGEVIGINVAIAEDAQDISFALPINLAKKSIEQVVKNNKIVYPFLGVRYTLVDESLKEKNNLTVNYGALILKGNNGEKAVTADSAAEKAGIKEGDIILEINEEKITTKNPLSVIIVKYNPGEEIKLKILREEKKKKCN